MEVVVVGAGPAGSTAALVLARAGVRVRIIDRAQFPRDKLCGDTLNPGALSIADRLGVRTPIVERALPISGMTVSGPGGAQVSADYPRALRGAAIARRDLDEILLKAAIAAGAEFDPGVAARGPVFADGSGAVKGVRVSRNGKSFSISAGVVIGAEGRHARLAAALGLSRFVSAPKRWAFGAYYSDVDALTSRGEMHVRRDGYIGVAPLPGGLANVCVVRELPRLQAPGSGVRPRGQTPGSDPDAGSDPGARHPATETLIAGAIAADPLLGARFRNARRVSPVTTLGPLGVESTAAGCHGLLLAGDSAGFIDPMTGDGLRFALRGGELAAEAALRELESGRPAHQALGAARSREFSLKWRLNRGLRVLVGSPRAVGVATKVSTFWEAPIRLLIALAGDVPLAERRRPVAPLHGHRAEGS
jgi:flavin-dependent dehydrogenase